MVTSTMTAKEAAKYIGTSYWKLLELCKVETIPCIRLGGRVLFRRETLDAWLADREAASIRHDSETRGKIRKLEA